MPQSSENRTQSAGSSTRNRASEAEWNKGVKDVITEVIKQQGFPAALKAILKSERSRSRPEMVTFYEGVGERLTAGICFGSFHTNQGHIRGYIITESAQRTDPQLISSDSSPSYDASPDSSEPTAVKILEQLTVAGAKAPCSLLCQVEFTRFDPSQREAILPLLWQYILDHRNSNDRNELVAVGSAIRKYIAIMPMDRMGDLAVLLEPGHRSPLPIDLEIEVAKMIYRNFEVHPPTIADPHPELAARLWEIVQAYINPRVLLRGKHSAVTSLAIEAIVSMHSPLAEQACQAANSCPYRWFAELISDDLDDLHEKWSKKSQDAAAWLRELRNNVFSCMI